MPTLSKFDICSAALLSFGARRIASFDESTAEGVVAAGLYDIIVGTEFGKHRWNFARADFLLNRVSGQTPADKFSYFYQLPGDCVLLRHVVGQAGAPITYETVRGRMIATSDEAPIAHYTQRVPEEQWPDFFVDLITQRCAAHFFGALRKDVAGRDRMLAAQDSPMPPVGAFIMAKKLDEQEGSAPQLPAGPRASSWRGRRL